MSEIALLEWVRGTGFQIATVILVVGVIIRIFEILMLGRKTNLAEAKGSEFASGMRTIVTRSVPTAESFKRSSLTIVAGYVFHLGLFVTIFLFAPHILLIKEVTGLSWPSLPTPIVDIVAIISIIALLVVLVHRFNNKVLRYLTNSGDLFAWFVTIAPLVTGYIAFHRIGMSGPMLLALHILSVELLMVVLPFTKLAHTFTIFMARWYNGAISGYRGVQS
jgi:nitrate reductase gamma subunit